MLFLNTNQTKASAEKDEQLIETQKPVFNNLENIVGTEAFARNEQMLQFPQYFKMSSVTQASKGTVVGNGSMTLEIIVGNKLSLILSKYSIFQHFLLLFFIR